MRITRRGLYIFSTLLPAFASMHAHASVPLPACAQTTTALRAATRVAAVICGAGGCNKVQTTKVQHPRRPPPGPPRMGQ
jgi:hypothetical protein